MTEDPKYEEKVLSLVALAAPGKCDISALKPETSLQKDLGFDSIRILALMFRLEEAFKVDAVDADIKFQIGRVRTVGDILSLSRAVLNRTTGAST